MLNCLTYIAFVYWAVTTVHTVLPIDVAVCGADVSRGGLGALFNHAFGGDLNVDVQSWQGFPCNSRLLTKMAFLLRRPGATVRHILNNGGQDEPYVPVLFAVPLLFLAVELARLLGLRLMTQAAARTVLKAGVALGCRFLILLQSLMYADKKSLYFKRYSKVEFCIIAWTAYIIELPVWHETFVTGGTAVITLLLCGLFPHQMLPVVNPINVAMQVVAATAFGIGHAYYLQRRRRAERVVRAACTAAADADTAEEAEWLHSKLQQDSGASISGTAATTAAKQCTPTFLAPPTAAPTAAVASAASAPTAAAAGSSPAASPTAVVAATAATAAAAPVTTNVPVSSGGAAAAAAAASLAALRRMHGLSSRRTYVSRARMCRFSIKVQHAHLADLPPNLMSVINSDVLCGSGWMAISAHAREGCVELVLDLRPLVATRPSYGTGSDNGNGGTLRDDRRAQPDQNRPDGDSGGTDGGGADDVAAAQAAPLDAASLRELGLSIVSYLHRTGVIRPEREQSVVLEMGTDTVVMTWQPETQTWVEAAAAAEGANVAEVVLPAALMPPTPPTLHNVSPRVTLWPGDGGRLRLTTLLTGPSAEEVLAGGGLVVRAGSCALPYSVLRVQPRITPEPSSMLLVELAVSGPPCSGLLQVEARSSTGLLSAPASVVVEFDSAVVAGLAALVAGMDDDSVDALLQDYGSWVDLAMSRAMAAAAASVAPLRNVYEIDTGAAELREKVSGDISGGSEGLGVGGGVGVHGTPPGAILTRVAGPAATVSYLVRREKEMRISGAGLALPLLPPPPPPPALMTVAADLLTVCCRGGADGAADNDAVAAVADRLIACVLAGCDDRTPASTFTALLDAVPAPPSDAGALHVAVAAGCRGVVEVLLRWHELLYGRGGGNGGFNGPTANNPWLTRASCGVTPLHVAAAMPDGGATSAWLLCRYDTAAAAWDSAAAMSDDGLTPAALAAQLGGRWRLRLAAPASGALRAVRRALMPPARLGCAAELIWSFCDPYLERRFADTVSYGQTAASLALQVAVGVLLLLIALMEPAMYGSFRNTTVAAGLAALFLHSPQAAPLLTWLCHAPPAAASTLLSTHFPVHLPYSCASSQLSRMPRARLLTAATAAAAATLRNLLRGFEVGGVSWGPLPRSLSCPRRRRRVALWAVHVCGSAVKAAVAAGLWLGSVQLPLNGVVRCGGDLVLLAALRPLLEQVDVRTRLRVTILDAPTTWLLFGGLERSHPGSVPLRPLGRLMLYQAVLLATTATISAANRMRFLRAQSMAAARIGGFSTAAMAGASAGKPSSWFPALYSSGGSSSSSSGGGGKASGKPRLPTWPSGSDRFFGGAAASKVSEGGCGGSAAAAGDAPKALRGDDQMAGGGGGGSAAVGRGYSFPALSGWAGLRGQR